VPLRIDEEHSVDPVELHDYRLVLPMALEASELKLLNMVRYSVAETTK
jgi:hypothetical protein